MRARDGGTWPGRLGNLATFLVILNFKLKCNKLHRNLLPISKSNLGIFVFPGCRSGSTLSLLSTEDKQLHLQNKPVYNFLKAGGKLTESGLMLC